MRNNVILVKIYFFWIEAKSIELVAVLASCKEELIPPPPNKMFYVNIIQLFLNIYHYIKY